MLPTIVWILAALALLIGVYYLIPNVPHVLADNATQIHVKHAVAFFAVAVVLFFGGRFARNSQSG